jgi:hypothetical protein
MAWKHGSRLGVVLCFASLWLTTGATLAQDARDAAAAAMMATGGPQDWSNQRVIYTRNGAPEDLMKVADDPRFVQSNVMHFMREHRNGNRAATVGMTGAEQGAGAEILDAQDDVPWEPLGPSAPLPRKNVNSKVDWSFSLGPNGGMAPGESPAVYTANYSSPSCTNDFAVYTINAAPTVNGQANLIGLDNLYTDGANAGFCAGTGPTILFAYAIGSGGSPLSPVLSLDGTRIAWIENRTATDAYLHVTVWVANQGSSSQGAAVVSGTFSNGACTPAGSSCDFALEYTNGTYPGCSTAYVAGNGHSDLYVDFTNNVGYISADNGLLYHIANIFSTTASPSVDFCIPVNTAFETAPQSAMSGPVYDRLTNQVYITDSEKVYGYTVNASSFTASTPNPSYAYGNAGSNYNYQTGPGPLLDVLNGYLYIFSTYDAAGNTSVTQVPVNLTSGVAVNLGPKNTNTTPMLFYGAFDNNYFNFGPKNAASTLYSCGTDSTTKTAQDLFSISFNASTGIVNTTPPMSYNKNVNPGATNGLCSPITEFYDGTNDRIFVGMGQPGANSGSNVVTMWNVNTQLTNTSGSGGTMPTWTAEATTYPGGASGISADNNDSGISEAESIYFTTEYLGGAPTQVPATTPYNVNAIYKDGQIFSCTGGLDNDGNAYSHNLLGNSVTWNGVTFTLGTSSVFDAWSNTTITLPAGQFNTLTILAAAVNVTQSGTNQTFTVNYTDGSSTTLTQNFSDWYNPLGFNGESIAKSMGYRDTCSGGKDNRTFDVYGYSFAINAKKIVKTLTLPATRNVVFLGAALSSGCGGADYCAVKLTQGALQ